MSNHDCYNFDFFKTWLNNNLEEQQDVDHKTSAKHIADNFSRLFFDVTEEDAVDALTQNGFSPTHIDGHCYFELDRSSPAFEKFQKTYN